MPEFLIIALIPIIFVTGIIMLIFSSYKKVEAGKALVISGVRGKKVSFSDILVVPVLEKYEIIDIRIKQVIIDLKDKNGLLTKDNYIVDLNAVFSIRINPVNNDVIKVAQTLGTQKASDIKELEKMFAPKFEEALRTVAPYFTFEDLKSELDKYKIEVLQNIGGDLNGFALDDLAINYIPTSVRKLEIK